MKQPRGLALQALQNLGTTPAAHGANFPCADADTDTYPDLDTDTDTWMQKRFFYGLNRAVFLVIARGQRRPVCEGKMSFSDEVELALVLNLTA